MVGASIGVKCPAPEIMRSCAPGMAETISCYIAIGVLTSFSPTITSVGQVMPESLS